MNAGQVVRVGGRLLRRVGTRLLIGDAIQTAEIELASRPDGAGARTPSLESQLSLHDWVVVRGISDGRGVRDAQLEQRFPGVMAPHSDSQRVWAAAPKLHALARARHACRSYFDARDFLEVTTPVRVQAPGTDIYIEPHACAEGWLITSPEFHMKRLLSGGHDRIYQFAQCTRDAEYGPWHQPEFTLLEWYRSFADVERIMTDTEHLVREVAAELGSTRLTIEGRERPIDLSAPFERISVADAYKRYAGIADVAELAAHDEDRYFQLMVDRIEPEIRKRDRGTFLCDYPTTQAALARKKPKDPRFAERFELFIGGIELCNGYGELTDANEQRARFERDQRERKRRNLPQLPIDEALLSALDDGLPPCSGNALGFERLVALLLDAPLAEVVSFPR